METDIKELKNRLRREFLQRRRGLAENLVKEWSESIQNHVIEKQEFSTAGVVALYAAFGNEPEVQGIIQKIQNSTKTFVLPRIKQQKGEMDFCLVDEFHQMKPGRFGICEPPENFDTVKVTDIDIILVPGVAYDLEMWRLGRGGGYYDRILAGIRPDAMTMGVAYSIMIAESVPHNEHDRRVDMLVTEKGFCDINTVDPA